MASLFIADAMGTPMSVSEQIPLLLFLLVASKGAAGVTGAGLATLAGGLQSHKPALVDGLGLIVGIDRFMSEARALTNFAGNAVATVLIGTWTKEIDKDARRGGPRRSAPLRREDAHRRERRLPPGPRRHRGPRAGRRQGTRQGLTPGGIGRREPPQWKSRQTRPGILRVAGHSPVVQPSGLGHPAGPPGAPGPRKTPSGQALPRTLAARPFPPPSSSKTQEGGCACRGSDRGRRTRLSFLRAARYTALSLFRKRDSPRKPQGESRREERQRHAK